MVEAKAFRYYGHFVGDPAIYMSKELEGYRARDPIAKFKKYILNEGLASTEELAGIDAKVTATLEEAITAAENAPWPAPEELLTDVYSVYNPQRR
jgi:acetoin:2,6-dichlorophenolindophenol oxidoreductase subunit alpha